jgi:hypothetical protein
MVHHLKRAEPYGCAVKRYGGMWLSPRGIQVPHESLGVSIMGHLMV